MATINPSTTARAQYVSSRRWPTSLAVAFLLGGALGTGVTTIVTDGGGDRRAPGVATSPPASPMSALPMSADAAERWLDDPVVVADHAVSADAAERRADADNDERRRLCTSSHVSADAAERCLSTG